jgi:hypothetical protein
MTTRIVHIRCLVAVTAFVLAQDGACRSGRWEAQAQSPTGSGEDVKRSARAIEEARGLVVELEAQVQRQRSQLQMTEASLRRARALVVELEGGRGTSQQGHAQQGNTFHSPEERRGLPEQAAAEKTEWSWSEEQATAEASARGLGGDYRVQIEPTPGKPSASTISLTRDGQPIYSWEGHTYSVFVLAHDVLYRADFSPGQTGCTVIARDLKAGKLLWTTHLWGVPVHAHSQYQNRINMKIDARHLTVYGNESFGRYIELLDLRTGKTVGHRLVGRSDSTR